MSGLDEIRPEYDGLADLATDTNGIVERWRGLDFECLLSGDCAAQETTKRAFPAID